MNRGTWVNGKRRQTGSWRFVRASDKFRIELDSRDPVTGMERAFDVYGETPEWGNWKLVRETGGQKGPHHD